MKINWFKIDNKEFFTQLCFLFKITIEHLEFNRHTTVKIYENISYFLIFLKQGYLCKDCNASYSYCICNKCKFCTYNTCIDEIDKNYIYNFIIRNISKKLILKMEKRFENSNIYWWDENAKELIMNKLKDLYENKLV